MRELWIAIAIVTVLATSACAQARVPAAEPATSAAATPTPSPEPLGPERVLDGDCGRLAAAADLSADAGVALTALAEPWIDEVAYAAVPQLGGMFCVWNGPAAEESSLSVIVLPSRSFTEVRPTGTECEGGSYCNFGAIESGFQFFGLLNIPGTESASVQAASDAITVRVAASLASAALPAPYAPEGAWARAIECATLDRGHVIATALGDPAIESYAYGGDAEPNSGFYVAYVASGLTHCDWIPVGDGSGASVSVDVMPGGAWRQADIEALDDTEVVAVAGYELALVRGNTLHTFTAVNRLDLTLDPGDTGLTLADFYPAATALAAELDAG
ncbi:MAG: hypothetical protein ABWZ15_11925 [Acidimicrobiia bacterium]